ncbi:hypothetical protein [Photobacterium sp. 1_MG-2023]|uniref:hypothetical protein n=1 Tax=Photobacterium sp. 1_MG-2023 TaxID=3062646 RepID=UPI0026E315B7|nr:hypothetical protein [Photobacterium sp. 1_MG-2023]MDO6705653.1 hypothetical protein [Photobacterium sp. 1_MG-2023]
MIRKVLSLLLIVLLQGCSGYVGGDLEDIQIDRYVRYCDDTPTTYQIRVTSNAVNDYGSENISGTLSTYTLGLFPTYWLSHVDSKTSILRGGKEIYSREDQSRIHTFYGILWQIFLPETVNSLRADEGSGLRVIEGIRERSVAKTLQEMPKDIDIQAVCLVL